MSNTEHGVIDIGVRLRGLRKSKAMTLAEVSRHSGLSVSYISKIERDQVKPSFEVLHRIVGVLGLELIDLITETVPASVDGLASAHENQAVALQKAFLTLLESDREILLEFAEFLQQRAQHKRIQPGDKPAAHPED